LAWNSSGKPDQCWKKPKPLISNITKAESSALKSLIHNKDIRVLAADKGNCTVVMNIPTNMEKLSTLLESGVMNASKII
jgi:hypothetical protein